MATNTVPLRPEKFNPLLLPPTLKGPGPRLDAPHYISPGYHSYLGIADGLVTVGSRAAIVCDSRRLKQGLTRYLLISQRITTLGRRLSLDAEDRETQRKVTCSISGLDMVPL